MKPIIAITMGDPSGIGAEITVKALADRQLYEQSIPVVYGDLLPMEEAVAFTHSELKIRCIETPEEALGEYGTIDLINLNRLSKGDWEYKKVSANSGSAAFAYIVAAIEMANQKRVHAVVTGPINKESINLAGHHYSGHTEIFAEFSKAKSYAMMLTTPVMRVIHCTTHTSMRNACDKITRQRVNEVIHLADQCLRELSVENPRIAVAGLNAHCSENGLFGYEEAESIIPAVNDAKQDGICVDGPIPPDTVFVKALAGQYDVVVAMYHDQGHIPIKLMGFKMDPVTKTYSSLQGVNLTAGLPIIRTSVDHGTAFGKAGEGRANEQSMVDAYLTAVCMAKNRFSL